jgi:hypothetical protein
MAMLARAAGVRAPEVVLATSVGAVGTGWSITVLGWGKLALLVAFRRWRRTCSRRSRSSSG